MVCVETERQWQSRSAPCMDRGCLGAKLLSLRPSEPKLTLHWPGGIRRLEMRTQQLQPRSTAHTGVSPHPALRMTMKSLRQRCHASGLRQTMMSWTRMSRDACPRCVTCDPRPAEPSVFELHAMTAACSACS